MFKLNQQVKLVSINARTEIHGEERKAAFDIQIEAQSPASVLDYFDPDLADMLYKVPDDPDLVEQGDPETATAPRFPKMSGFRWEWEGSGYTTTIDYGLGGDSNIKLPDTKIDKFRFAPQNGGTVLISFRLIVHPETADVGLLCERIQQNIDIALEPPKPVEDLLTTTPKKKRTSKADAEKLFSPQEAWPLPDDETASGQPDEDESLNVE